LAVVPLEATGPKGVGVEQAQACRTCKNFGATVSARPDSLGKTAVDQCMNTPCNISKIALRIRAEQQQAAPGASNGASNKGTSAGSTAPAPKKPVSSEPSTAMRTYREEIWRDVLRKVVTAADMKVNRSVLLAYMLTGPNVISDHVLGEAVSLKTGVAAKPGEVLAMLLKLETAQLASELQHAAASTGNGLSITNVAGMLTVLDVKLEEHWVIDQALLSKLTKNEIDALCSELGIKNAMGEGYAKALNGKKDDFIKAVLSIEGFTYRGLVPNAMKW
jgi:ParB family transcriptional regulator, chromosome partitioning protein